MAKRTLTNPHGLPEIYARRQPRRPHYIAEWMQRRQIKRADLIDAIGVDKGMVSRWLDDEKPTTPGPEWTAKLNACFGGEGDPVDIFQHPDDDWFSRMVRNNTQDKVRQAIQILEAAGITPKGEYPPKKTSSRS
jgi:hypothetical protein